MLTVEKLQDMTKGAYGAPLSRKVCRVGCCDLADLVEACPDNCLEDGACKQLKDVCKVRKEHQSKHREKLHGESLRALKAGKTKEAAQLRREVNDCVALVELPIADYRKLCDSAKVGGQPAKK